jgi:hypothetical protein
MPGVVIDESKYGGKAERLEPAAMPAGLMTLAERADRDIPEVSGINSDLMGTKPNDSESGRARLIRQEAGLVATEIMSDNFARSVNTLGELLLNVIRFTDIYSDEEIGAIVEDQHLVDFMDVDPASGRTVVHLDAMNDWHVGEYGVVVADSPNRPTVREANFDQAAQLVQMGVSVPPDVLIDLSDMPDKEKVKQRLAQAQGQLAAGAAG